MGKKENKWELSDLFKAGTFIYIIYDCAHVSSPNTDTTTLLMAFYIIIKWAEFTEKNITDAGVYAHLCIIIVYITTFKLSAGIFVVLALYPAIKLIQEKDLKSILSYMFGGVIALIPYLIRNVLISGYIIYPYEFTGIKMLDWIMPEEILKADRNEIIAWGRGNYDVSRNGEYIWQWIGQWFAEINILWKILFVISILSMTYIIICLIRNSVIRRATPYMNLIIWAFCGLLFWLMTAPLPRYGTIYMISLPCIAIDMWLKSHSSEKAVELLVKNSAKIKCALCYGVGILYILVFIVYTHMLSIEHIGILYQQDYQNRETYAISDSGIDIYVPTSGDQTGYEPFPTAPYPGSAQNIVLRGDKIEDGFKNK